MTLSSYISGKGSRWMMLLAVIFAVVAGLETKKRIQSASYNREAYPEFATAPLQGADVVEYEFTAQHQLLKGLWVYFRIPPNASPEGRLILSMRHVGDDHPFWTQSFPCNQALLIGNAHLLKVEGLLLRKGERYVLTYAMPDVKPGQGWQLLYTPMADPASTVKWGSQVKTPAEPCMLWLEGKRHYPFVYMLVCAALVAVCALAARRDTSSYAIPALIIMAAGCVLSGAYYWQLNLWHFWGNYWPDGCPVLSREAYRFLSGQTTFKECLAFFAQNRCGQAFVVPMMMGTFQVAGLSVKGSYIATNAVFLATSVALLLGLLRLYAIKEDRLIIAAGLVFFSHRCVIGSVGELQTDLAGMAGTLLFAYPLLRSFATEDSRTRLWWYFLTGCAAFLGCISRLSLAPLMVVPACLFVWSICFERKRSWGERISYLIPTLTSGALLWICWSSLGLWGTLTKYWAFAVECMGFFHWSGFIISTLLVLHLSLLVLALMWRKLFCDRGFAAIVGGIVGLMMLVVYSGLPIWLRYWTPASTLGIVLCIWALKEWRQKEWLLLGAAWISALAQTVILLEYLAAP